MKGEIHIFIKITVCLRLTKGTELSRLLKNCIKNKKKIMVKMKSKKFPNNGKRRTDVGKLLQRTAPENLNVFFFS